MSVISGAVEAGQSYVNVQRENLRYAGNTVQNYAHTAGNAAERAINLDPLGAAREVGNGVQRQAGHIRSWLGNQFENILGR